LAISVALLGENVPTITLAMSLARSLGLQRSPSAFLSRSSMLVLLDASGERHAVLLGLGRAFPLLWYRG
jgi:hypothetical protein